MRYRTSYGQNVLNHSIEVSHIANYLLAAEIGANVTEAKRAYLLHDLGKSIDHEVEGSHVTIGVELARKYHESEAVIHAIHAHHNDVEPQTIVACLVQAVDAISAARPGYPAGESENYIKRLEKAGGDHLLPWGGEVLRHPGLPRGPHHGQARGGQRGSDGPSGPGYCQEDRGRAGVPRTDQGQPSAGDQGHRVRQVKQIRRRLKGAFKKQLPAALRQGSCFLDESPCGERSPPFPHGVCVSLCVKRMSAELREQGGVMSFAMSEALLQFCSKCSTPLCFAVSVMQRIARKGMILT